MSDYDTTDVRQMRRELKELARDWCRFDERAASFPSACSSIVRNCFMMAEANGLSGEDLYTVMAWHLQKHAAEMEKFALNDAMLRPPPMIIATKE